MRIKFLYILLFVICLFSCNGNKSTTQAINENSQEIIPSDTIPLGLQFRQKCEQMEQDSLLHGVKQFSYDIHCYDSCIYSLTVDIKMQYPEMPDNSYASYKNNNVLESFFCRLGKFNCVDHNASRNAFNSSLERQVVHSPLHAQIERFIKQILII